MVNKTTFIEFEQMVIEIIEEMKNMLNEIFEKDCGKMHLAQIVVNERKRALVISNVPVGELFSSRIHKETGTTSLVVDIDKEKSIHATE